MKCIDLIQSIRMFGLLYGSKFWFNWHFVMPVQQFIWFNITHKPYCLQHGWYLCNDKCEHKKLYKKEDVLKHREEIRKELNTVEKGKNGMCIYCEDEKGEVEINNPNLDKLTKWLVCKTCEEVIKNQHRLSMGILTKNDKIATEAQNKLEEIAEKTGKPIFIDSIIKTKKGYKTSSVEFTGEKNEKIL